MNEWRIYEGKEGAHLAEVEAQAKASIRLAEIELEKRKDRIIAMVFLIPVILGIIAAVVVEIVT